MTDVRLTLDDSEWRKLKARADGAKVIGVALDATALEAKGHLSKYPPQRHGAAIWSSDPAKRKKQRAGFFAKLKAGEIDAPYRRGLSNGSQKLGQSWTVGKPAAHIRVIGTAAKYAQLVQGEKQTRYHQITGWKKVDDMMADLQPRLQAVLVNTVRKLL